MLWPLIVSIFITSPVVTIWIYVLAMLADIALFVLWLLRAIRYSQQAARGELFEIPIVTRFTGGLTGTGK